MPLPPAITDTNVLLKAAAALARGDEKYGTFEAIKTRGFITKSVDKETTERTIKYAKKFKLDPAAMYAAWMHELRPHLRVVNITDAELEHEAIDEVCSRNADQADRDTAALAVLLSPCMVITDDDDLRAVAYPNLASDVARETRHAEPNFHVVARMREPLVGMHVAKQGAMVGGAMAWDMGSSAVKRLTRSPLGIVVLAFGGYAAFRATQNPTVRAKVSSALEVLIDGAGTVSTEALAAELDCTVRMFPTAAPQSLEHRIAQEIVHESLWLAPPTIASRIAEDEQRVAAACRHKWFAPGVFGSVKVGVRHDAPQVVDVEPR